MKLGIDARLYWQTGVGVYIRNLLLHFRHLLPSDWRIFIYTMDGKLSFEKPQNWIVRKTPFRWHSFSEQTSFLKELLKDRLDLMHFTYFSYPVFYNRAFVITLHDLTPLKFKTGKASQRNKIIYEIKHFFYQLVLKKAIKSAKIIIVPSHEVKKDVLKIGGEEERINVIYEGVDEEIKKITEKKIEVKKPYFLYVGNFYPHKNVEFAIDVFLKFSERKKVYFYLVGPEDFFAKRLKGKYKGILRKKIFFLHNLSRAELKFLYKNSLALIHPSLAEGFGLTLLEAFYFGTPVIASKLPVFKEIYGDLPLYFNPKVKRELLKNLEKIYSKKVKISKLKISEIIKKYSFLKTAEQTLSIYKKYLV